MSRTYHSSLLQLIHKSACTVVADRELTLNHGCRANLGVHDGMGCLNKERIP